MLCGYIWLWRCPVHDALQGRVLECLLSAQPVLHRSECHLGKMRVSCVSKYTYCRFWHSDGTPLHTKPSEDQSISQEGGGRRAELGPERNAWYVCTVCMYARTSDRLVRLEPRVPTVRMDTWGVGQPRQRVSIVARLLR